MICKRTRIFNVAARKNYKKFKTGVLKEKKNS